MMTYIPKETHVKSTSEVVNIFDKPAIEAGPEDSSVPESELTTVQKVRR